MGWDGMGSGDVHWNGVGGWRYSSGSMVGNGVG